jgi:hypothetical protein
MNYIQSEGYKVIAKCSKKFYEHRLVMEKMLGRKLLPKENIHHINGNKLDNRPENLELFIDQSKHTFKYHAGRKLVIPYNAFKICKGCGKKYFRKKISTYKWRKKKFCSNMCYHSNAKRGYHGHIISA